MTAENRGFLKEFFRSVKRESLEPTDSPYVSIYDSPAIGFDDPMALLEKGIEWTPGQSVQLFSGFRGTGKSTELRRLRNNLKASGYLVVLCDIEDYVNLSLPIEITDFLLAVAGAFSDALEGAELLGSNPARASYWERFAHFLTKTKVKLDELGLEMNVKAAAVSAKASLKRDPSFKEKLETALRGHLGAFADSVNAFFEDAVRDLQERHGISREVVLLVDSLEHLQGTFTKAEEVHQSAETLFAHHADKLHFKNLHVVYTVPPYLKVRYPNIGTLYRPGGFLLLPSIKIQERNREGTAGAAFEPGVALLRDLVSKRGDWRKLLGTQENLDQLIRFSGGHLRDLLYLLGEVLRRAQGLPVEGRVVEAAIDQVRTEFLPIADQDAVWLERVAQTQTAALEQSGQLPHLARFFDTHMVLCYRNGCEWYDVHPLIAEVVRAQAAAWHERQAKRTNGGEAEEEA